MLRKERGEENPTFSAWLLFLELALCKIFRSKILWSDTYSKSGNEETIGMVKLILEREEEVKLRRFVFVLERCVSGRFGLGKEKSRPT